MTFIILVLVVQQIDSNILDPMITGNATGLSSLGVIVAVTVMGNYFGVLGMFLGVPITVSIFSLGRRFLNYKLSADSMPTELDEISRKIMQLEIEKQALGKETDKASAARLATLEKELAALREEDKSMRAQWENEKNAIEVMKYQTASGR